MAARVVPAGGWMGRLKPERTPRVKVRPHLDWIKRLPCVCCAIEGRQRQADDPMHVRSGALHYGKEHTGGGQTSDDRWTLPGCRPHHNEQNAVGGEGEMAFWRRYGVDPHLLAMILWGLTGDDHRAVEVIFYWAGRAARGRR